MKKLLAILISSNVLFLITLGVFAHNYNNHINYAENYNSKRNIAEHEFSDSSKKVLSKVGYYNHGGKMRISQIPPTVEIIDADLPPQITSLRTAFVGSKHNITWKRKWDTKNITDMNSAFYNRSSFNSSDISDWDTSNVVDMGEMFFGVVDFDQDLSKWDTSKVRNFEQMFEGAEKFNNKNNPLNWNDKLKNANNMKRMFKGAKSFDQDISEWDISNVKNFEQMFEGANKFNNNDKPLNWGNKLKSVNNMKRMFKDASSFKHNLSSWLMKTVVNNEDFGLEHDKQPKWKIESSPADISVPNIPKSDDSSSALPKNDNFHIPSPSTKPDINSDSPDTQPPVAPPTKPEKPELPNVDNETIDKNEDIKNNIENPKIDNNPHKIPAKPNTIIKPNSPSAGVIAGAVLGSFAALGIVGGTGYYYRKNLKNFYLNSADKTKNLYFKSKEKIKDKLSKIKSKK
ncbi:BspA family leucine-rich repeat surface protein [Mycoplasma mycoides]|uniref:BspA family leucine-rich repeat surface protein n=1 Tax=Mycoplasma mycoides TaxID=2102 RepID=UPI002735D84F|nr:BspA family leucine-rich repeat surface protein [Mycoplasma mycoides]MDP4040809.1 BspA family leucine-rich repeat surface protein [Mycoplasma mycoides]MDP4041696.1 BspA family leucine-rich repeat surface protein [Mycoplasma mycoides]MDP4042570.1 BspA family leucine-rich repeat surface protein [Mycoplasma mycoides]MDP4044029.1 BspA family leucine-rich repeat surface protein [Mycoplasma mycoides]MDP4044643.1 BspA family leucine-rich repeat surface protein [Mycoplasma mycoides]